MRKFEKATPGFAVEVSEIPQCDVCNNGKPAEFDARLPGLGGSWGNVCYKCWVDLGPGKLGTGFGQQYLLRPEALKSIKCGDLHQYEIGISARCIVCGGQKDDPLHT